MSIVKTKFGMLSDSMEVFEYTLKNESGMTVKILTYGATIKEITVPDRNGNFADIVGGYDTLDSYVNADGYQGAVIGRIGNRIAKGKFTLDGVEYNLFINNGPNHLHGGEYGFNSKVWTVCEEKDGCNPTLLLNYISPDKEEGYPGNLNVFVRYTLTNDNALELNYTATTDKKTPINITNHTYFNLGGYNSGSIHSHYLTLDANTYLPTDDTLIPTGELKSVTGTPFDFTTSKPIGKDINSGDTDLMLAGGYDHCLNFKGGETKVAVKRAELYDPASGRVMEVYTNQPCVQLYSGNFLTNEKFPFKSGYPQTPQTFVCLETQKMPDSVNHENFTNVYLSPNEKYDYTTIYKFKTR